MSWFLRLFDSTVGQKVITAATGLGLMAFVIGHALGNLQIFLGPDAANGVWTDGTFAYVADRLAGLQVIDVSSCDASCPDTDGNSLVDLTDLLAVLADWGTDGSGHGGDVDGNGEVGFTDLLAVLVSWGACP